MGGPQEVQNGDRGERARSLKEIRAANAKLADLVIDHLFMPGIYLGPGRQRARAYLTDGRSYAISLTNYAHAGTAEAFRAAKDRRDRMMLVLIAQPQGELGYDLQERTSDHTLLDLNESWVAEDNRIYSAPFPREGTHYKDREYERARKYNELLAAVVKAWGMDADAATAE